MNIFESNILLHLFSMPFISQRALANACGCSLGIINKSLNSLVEKGYLDNNKQPTPKAKHQTLISAPKNAIILAAGFGMRMVPLNTEFPKAFLEVNGEPLIERLITQLQNAGITSIYIVVGFMKEKFEYLIDKFNVTLIINPNYATKNNLTSLQMASNYLSNSYIIPCDIWCLENPFHRHELYSWYMISDSPDETSSVRINRKFELTVLDTNTTGNSMIGICYLLEKDAQIVKDRLAAYSKNKRYDNSFWEETLYEKNKMFIKAKLISSHEVIELNTYEQLRELDCNSNQLQSEAIQLIQQVLNTTANEITNISILKKGMTNRSFIFTCKSEKYIMRIPGEGTNQLINRSEEASVYQNLNSLHISDEPIYMNPLNGYKLTKFHANARTCNEKDDTDLYKCMSKLRDFHNLNLQVSHKFDLYQKIDFYESLWNNVASAYQDYELTKTHILELRPYIEQHVTHTCLCHIDSVPDNFLFIKTDAEKEEIRLIDWEYAAMQDPHIDIAMFCIYSLYDKTQIDHLIDIYFENHCPDTIRIKIYCYIAACGLLWSNWCEYKHSLGIEFGEYSLRQYRYAKDYYTIAKEYLGENELCII